MSLDYENRKLHIFVSVYIHYQSMQCYTNFGRFKTKRSYVLVLNEVTFPLTRVLIHLAI